MERDTTGSKEIEWEYIIEFFTKRGRPLTKEEMTKLQQEDERIKLEGEEIKRKEEEMLRRQEQRLMQNIENDQDA